MKFGEMTPAQKRAVMEHARDQLQSELQAASPAIGRILDADLARDMLETAAEAACNARERDMPKRDGKPVVLWKDKPEEVKIRWRSAMIAARNALGLNELWQPEDEPEDRPATLPHWVPAEPEPAQVDEYVTALRWDWAANGW
jgi:hypothetical protein